MIFLNTRGSEPVQLNLGGDYHEYLRFHYFRCALQELNAEDYWESSNLIARLCLNLMKWKEEQQLEVYARAVQGLSTLEPDPEKQLKYITSSTSTQPWMIMKWNNIKRNTRRRATPWPR